MEPTTTTVPGAKYQKLASEYAKMRAQASVLKKAVLEEQAKSGGLREHLRQRETSLRRSEQEVDSLGFRNKQLEHRVAVLQEEIASREGRKKDIKRSESLKNGPMDTAQDVLIFEELQKKIIENAQLTSLIDDKERELRLHSERILCLEQMVDKRTSEQSDLEKRLRRDLETLQCRNAELETKLVEAASIFGSEDALSASGSDTTPLHNTHQNHVINSAVAPVASSATLSCEERIACLEKEVSHWRTQYEIAKLQETFASGNKENQKQPANLSGHANLMLQGEVSCGCSSTAAGISVQPSYAESKSAQRARDSLKEPPAPVTREQQIYNNFSKKFEELLRAKSMAESRVTTFETEAQYLQNCLENVTNQTKSKEEQVLSLNQALQMLEEDLATTRINYEEQICVLTEQVISLSEQLAACK